MARKLIEVHDTKTGNRFIVPEKNLMGNHQGLFWEAYGAETGEPQRYRWKEAGEEQEATLEPVKPKSEVSELMEMNLKLMKELAELKSELSKPKKSK